MKTSIFPKLLFLVLLLLPNMLSAAEAEAANEKPPIPYTEEKKHKNSISFDISEVFDINSEISTNRNNEGDALPNQAIEENIETFFETLIEEGPSNDFSVEYILNDSDESFNSQYMNENGKIEILATQNYDENAKKNLADVELFSQLNIKINNKNMSCNFLLPYNRAKNRLIIAKNNEYAEGVLHILYQMGDIRIPIMDLLQQFKKVKLGKESSILFPHYTVQIQDSLYTPYLLDLWMWGFDKKKDKITLDHLQINKSNDNKKGNKKRKVDIEPPKIKLINGKKSGKTTIKAAITSSLLPFAEIKILLRVRYMYDDLNRMHWKDKIHTFVKLDNSDRVLIGLKIFTLNIERKVQPIIIWFDIPYIIKYFESNDIPMQNNNRKNPKPSIVEKDNFWVDIHKRRYRIKPQLINKYISCVKNNKDIRVLKTGNKIKQYTVLYENNTDQPLVKLPVIKNKEQLLIEKEIFMAQANNDESVKETSEIIPKDMENDTVIKNLEKSQISSVYMGKHDVQHLNKPINKELKKIDQNKELIENMINSPLSVIDENHTISGVENNTMRNNKQAPRNIISKGNDSSDSNDDDVLNEPSQLIKVNNNTFTYTTTYTTKRSSTDQIHNFDNQQLPPLSPMLNLGYSSTSNHNLENGYPETFNTQQKNIGDEYNSDNSLHEYNKDGSISPFVEYDNNEHIMINSNEGTHQREIELVSQNKKPITFQSNIIPPNNSPSNDNQTIKKVFIGITVGTIVVGLARLVYVKWKKKKTSTSEKSKE